MFMDGSLLHEFSLFLIVFFCCSCCYGIEEMKRIRFVCFFLFVWFVCLVI